MSTFIDAYQTFWESPILLLALSAPLLLIAVWMAGRQHPGLFRTA
jgi:hypothetical protein